MDDAKARLAPAIKNFHRLYEYGSPESPLSKMNVLLNPLPVVNPNKTDNLMSPHSVSQLEFPTPERLLPIGQHGKDNLGSLAEKVREALAVPEQSFLKQDSFDKSEVCRHTYCFPNHEYQSTFNCSAEYRQ